MKSNNTFAAFRFFIVPSEQISFFDTIAEKRQVAVNDFFNNLEREKKISYEINGRKHIFVFNRKIGPNIYICKFSREISKTLYKEGESDIENIIEPDLPFIYLIIDIKRQILLIEIKTSVFQILGTAKKSIKKCFEKAFNIFGFEVLIEEITDEGTFWTFVDASLGVYEVTLKLNSPNLFGGHIDTNEILKEVNQQYNNTDATIKLANEKPKLKSINKENHLLANAIKYISGGAGEWGLTVHTKTSKKKTYRSRHNIKKVNIRAIDPPDDSSKSNEEILAAIDSVETILEKNHEEKGKKN